MSALTGDYGKMEKPSAIIFKDYIQQTQVRQIVYLRGIVNEELSKHLSIK